MKQKYIYTFEYGGYEHKLSTENAKIKAKDFLTEEIIKTYKAGDIAVLKKKEKVDIKDGKVICTEVSIG